MPQPDPGPNPRSWLPSTPAVGPWKERASVFPSVKWDCLSLSMQFPVPGSRPIPVWREFGSALALSGALAPRGSFLSLSLPIHGKKTGSLNVF